MRTTPDGNPRSPGAAGSARTVAMVKVITSDINGPTEFETVLEALRVSRVMEIRQQPDGRFKVEEQCDEYFYVTLTAEQLRLLGAELMALANGGQSPNAPALPPGWAKGGQNAD